VRFFFAAKSSDAKLSWSAIPRPLESMTPVCHDPRVVQRFPKSLILLAGELGHPDTPNNPLTLLVFLVAVKEVYH